MRCKKGLLLLIIVSGIISAADNWIASLLLPSIADTFGVQVSAASAVLTAYLIPYGLLQPVYGHLSDRYGRGKILISLMLFLAIFTLLCSTAKSLAWLVLFRFCTGCAAAGIIAVCLGVIGDAYDDKDRQKIVAIFLGSVFLGQGLSAALGGWAVARFSWREIFLAFSALSAVSFVSLFTLNFKDAPKSKGESFVKSLASLRGDAALLRSYFLALCNGVIVLGAYSFIGAYLLKKLGLSSNFAGACLMLYGVACFLAGNAARYLKEKLPPKEILSLGFLASASALCLLASCFAATAYVGTFLLGFGYVCAQSVLASAALRCSSAKGLSSGIIGTAIFFGGGIGTAVGGKALEYLSYQGLFCGFAALAAVLLIFYRASFKGTHEI